MNIEQICNVFIQGIKDGNENKDLTQQENFNLQDVYDYGYVLSKTIKITDK